MRSYYQLRRLGYPLDEIQDIAFDRLRDTPARDLMAEYPKAMLFDEIVSDITADHFIGEYDEENEPPEYRALYDTFAAEPIWFLAKHMDSNTRYLLDGCLAEIARDLVRDL